MWRTCVATKLQALCIKGLGPLQLEMGLWRSGSVFDSISEGWEFESLWPDICTRHTALKDRANFSHVLARAWHPFRRVRLL